MKIKKQYIFLVIILLISAIVIFHNLGKSTIFDWDEARRAQNALELIRTKDFIVIQYGGEPDLLNLKPPLGIWLIALSFSTLGVSEFSLRFFTALFGVGTIGLVFLLGKALKNSYTGIFSSLILLTNSMFIGYHGARTGDFDVMVIFFMTLSLYLFYLSQEKKRPKLIIASSIALALGFLIKMQAILVLAIIIAYLLYTKKFKKTIKKEDTNLSIILFFIITLPWFILRYLRGKEFFITKIKWDIIQRFTQSIEGHTGDWTFYFLRIYEGFGYILTIILIFSIIYLTYNLFQKKDKPTVFLFCWTIIIFLIMSLIQTKIFWYILPAYPALALIIGYAISPNKDSDTQLKILYIILFVLIIFYPVINTIRITNQVNIASNLESIKQLKDELKDYDKIYSQHRYTEQAEFFYLSWYTNSIPKKYKSIEETEIKPGEAVITFSKSESEYLKQNKDFTLIKEVDSVGLFERRL